MFLEETWESCTYDQTSLDAASSVVVEEYFGLSSFQCLALATYHTWVYLVVLGVGGSCNLYNEDGATAATATKDHTAGTKNCKMKIGFVGKLQSLKLGQLI